ncbi:hypothetical protein MMSR116_18300 [Methylobacterium mesophilicum SR1.6/6]|uniref:Helix-turn-helix domain-containing protein n=1 Tax=Methylobacterium mesophilicum SR1.6/6 TaxID=908290 RepID=A0A6B9FNP1_9HYPH|nr:hypothetical protein [Methylobacterium mesophilicum]QGY03622.1 hypothetical protein MMSR116_18300 [Methylobacterium mesophilicum SR1.6/6]
MSKVILLDLSRPRDRERRTNTTPPSHPHDTGSSSYKSYTSVFNYNYDQADNINPIADEIEIKFEAYANKTKPKARFLKGPIPLESLAVASRLPGKALAVYIALRHRCDLEGKNTVSLPAALLRSFGVDRDSKARALRVLENAGLIQVERTPGRAARITLTLSAQTV